MQYIPRLHTPGHHVHGMAQVNFPVVGLDMRPFIGSPTVQGDWVYDLFAVSVRCVAHFYLLRCCQFGSGTWLETVPIRGRTGVVPGLNLPSNLPCCGRAEPLR